MRKRRSTTLEPTKQQQRRQSTQNPSEQVFLGIFLTIRCAAERGPGLGHSTEQPGAVSSRNASATPLQVPEEPETFRHGKNKTHLMPGSPPSHPFGRDRAGLGAPQTPSWPKGPSPAEAGDGQPSLGTAPLPERWEHWSETRSCPAAQQDPLQPLHCPEILPEQWDRLLEEDFGIIKGLLQTPSFPVCPHRGCFPEREADGCHNSRKTGFN